MIPKPGGRSRIDEDIKTHGLRPRTVHFTPMKQIPIGAGTHERSVVNVGRIIEKMTVRYGAAP
jgi:hypothetical protein